jgi:hypothetical protein
MRKLLFIVCAFISIQSFAQHRFQYGVKAENVLSFNGTLLSEYLDIDINGNYSDSVKLFYNIEVDSLVLYTVNNIKGVPGYQVYRKAIAVKDITLTRQDTELQKEGRHDLFLYFFKITSKEDGMMRGTNYSNDTIEYYTGTFLYFAFSKENKAFGEKTLELFKELFGK